MAVRMATEWGGVVGTWGAGNFDSDTAADHLSELVGRLVAEVGEAVGGDPGGIEPDEYDGVAVPCNLELLLLLHSRGWVGVTLPAPEVVRGWRDAYMAVWERTIDGLEPVEGFKDERRAVLVGTFDRLAEAAAGQRESTG
ncbi:DUF4259 domain-containing protein [Streptomyces sp. SID2563]|uniref:DUF4259 domain-containing protein n=1 Tax=Streptomyces sp. SID2563 TaxID=2690255 RepID=UPI00136B9713|nr:DUF4259 domain-containing protein [Streptomyces sp. SID2563]MYW13744.1 DUF4259 domain-containing protein [Streptomyces sp. SID2563]